MPESGYGQESSTHALLQRKPSFTTSSTNGDDTKDSDDRSNATTIHNTLDLEPKQHPEHAHKCAIAVDRAPRLHPIALEPHQLRGASDSLDFLTSLARVEIRDTRVRDGVTYYVLDIFCHRFDTHLPTRLSDLRRRAVESALRQSGAQSTKSNVNGSRTRTASGAAPVTSGADASADSTGSGCTDASTSIRDATSTATSTDTSTNSTDTATATTTTTAQSDFRVERRFSDFCQLRAHVYELACLDPHFRCRLCNEFVIHVRFAGRQPRSLAKVTTTTRQRKTLLADFLSGFVRLVLQCWHLRNRACTSHDAIPALLASFMRDQEPSDECMEHRVCENTADASSTTPVPSSIVSAL